MRGNTSYDVHPRAKPFDLVGGDVNCLLIHGLTSSPSEMRLLGEYLNGHGFAVHVPLLPGHGTRPEHLNDTSWPEWYQAAEDAARGLLEPGIPLVVIGLSMGGLLSLQLAARMEGLAGAVCINPPLVLRDWKSKWARLIKVFRHYIPKFIGDEDRLMEARGRFAYDRIPLKAFLSLQSLVKDTVKRLENIRVPILAVQGEKDEMVDPRSYRILERGVPPGMLHRLVLRNSPHVATMGDELEQLGAEIVKFIETISAEA